MSGTSAAVAERMEQDMAGKYAAAAIKASATKTHDPTSALSKAHEHRGNGGSKPRAPRSVAGHEKLPPVCQAVVSPWIVRSRARPRGRRLHRLRCGGRR